MQIPTPSKAAQLWKLLFIAGGLTKIRWCVSSWSAFLILPVDNVISSSPHGQEKQAHLRQPKHLRARKGRHRRLNGLTVPKWPSEIIEGALIAQVAAVGVLNKVTFEQFKFLRIPPWTSHHFSVVFTARRSAVCRQVTNISTCPRAPPSGGPPDRRYRGQHRCSRIRPRPQRHIAQESIKACPGWWLKYSIKSFPTVIRSGDHLCLCSGEKEDRWNIICLYVGIQFSSDGSIWPGGGHRCRGQ